jgi:CBS domain-containing protein
MGLTMQRVHRSIHGFVRGLSPPTAKIDTPVSEAVSTMRARQVACVLIIADDGGGKLVGIFTERDLLNRVVAQGLSVDDTTLGEVMTPNPETLQLGDSISFAINRMAVGGYRNVPIVDAHHKPLAVLSIRHVVKHLRDVFEDSELIDLPAEVASPWVDIGGSG